LQKSIDLAAPMTTMDDNPINQLKANYLCLRLPMRYQYPSGLKLHSSS